MRISSRCKACNGSFEIVVSPMSHAINIICGSCGARYLTAIGKDENTVRYLGNLEPVFPMATFRSSVPTKKIEMWEQSGFFGAI